MPNIVLLRNRGLGLGSCKKLVNYMKESEWYGRFGWTTDVNLVGEDDIVIRWGSRKVIDNNVHSIYNYASDMIFVTNKAHFRLRCSNMGISPDTWRSINDVPLGALEGDGVILRPSRHSQGVNCHHVKSPMSMVTLAELYDDYYISRYIPKVAEFRVMVVQGRVAWVANKTPEDPTAIAWNHSAGSSFANVKWGDWNIEVCSVAIKAAQLSKLNFTGVDVMLDAQGRAYVLECNSAPTLSSDYRVKCTAKAFLDMIEEDVMYESSESPRSWKDVISPAISDRAILDPEEANDE